MLAASQLPGRDPLMCLLPLYLQINQISNDDDDDNDPLEATVLHYSAKNFTRMSCLDDIMVKLEYGLL